MRCARNATPNIPCTMHRFSSRCTIAAAALACVGVAQATLLDRGNGMLYDTVLDITWLQDAGIDEGAQRDWYQSADWAAQLVYGGYDDWRLASVNRPYDFDNPPGPAVDCSSATAQQCAAGRNELGYMYYFNIGATPGTVVLGDRLVDGVTVKNIQGLYWGNQTYPGEYSFFFGFAGDGAGQQGIALGGLETAGAWAVRDGDVAAAVPEPSTWALLGLGLAALMLRNHKRRLV